MATELDRLILADFPKRQANAILAAIAAAGGGGGGGGGGSFLGFGRARQFVPGTITQTEVTTGNGSVTPYTRLAFPNWLVGNAYTNNACPEIELVTENGQYGFDVTESGIYQVHATIQYAFVGGEAPDSISWRVNTYGDYYDQESIPSLGFATTHSDGGGLVTLTTPPFYEEAWSESDGSYYLSITAAWKGIGMTISAPYGGSPPFVNVIVTRLA